VVDLTLKTHTEANRTVLEVAGEVDVYTGPTLRDRISDLLDSGAHDLVVDLGKVDFIDSTGLGVLVGALNGAKDLGGSLQLVCAQERVLKLLRITGLDQVFTVRASLAEVTDGEATDGDGAEASNEAGAAAGQTADGGSEPS